MMTGEVHLWRAGLVFPDKEIAEFRKILSDDEREKADRFHFAKDRNRFIVSRGILRTILGRYLSLDPSRISFSYSPEGKPAFKGNPKKIHFNLSHSHEMALYAFAVGREVGVDVEYRRALSDAEQLARRYFTSQEIARFHSAPPDHKDEIFFAIWTAKEAFLKATGKGLSVSLNTIDVSPLFHGDFFSLRDSLNRDWTLRRLKVEGDYTAALAFAGRSDQLCFDLLNFDRAPCEGVK